MNYTLNQGPSDKNFFKRNYFDVLEILTPKVYFTEDINLSGVEFSVLDQIIKTHLNLATNIGSIFNVSHVNTGTNFSSLSGVSQYFVKQNGLTNITTKEFEIKILDKLGKSLSEFSSETSFRQYVEDTLIPNIRLNSPNYLFGKATAAEAHGYLLDTLSWMYILNTSANGNLAFQPSTLVVDRLVDNIYYGGTVTLNEAMKDVTEYIWKNYTTCSLFGQKQLIPAAFLSGTGAYVSGTQQLDKIKTLIDVLYSPLFSDSRDTRIKDAFDLYIATSKFTLETESAGPFSKFLKAISYATYDVDDQINKINILYDIDRCPDELLPRIADLIAWDLIGDNPEKWRTQLRNAMAVYKAKGTKRALNLVLNSTFGETSFNLSSQIDELYESYIPNLLYYCLITESPFLQDFSTWTLATANSLGIPNYSQSDMDTNVRFVVDDIIRDAYLLYPQNFFIGSVPFSRTATYSYRGTINDMPPWELEKYYRYCRIDKRLVNYFVDRLLCFGVPDYVVNSFRDLILNNTLDSTDTLSINNNWLIFTSSIEYAPNKNDILSNFKKDKTKYLTLWSGKSSSFSLNLESSSFEFKKYSSDLLTTKGLKNILRAVYEFTPAHAIPLVTLGLEDIDYAKYDEYSCAEIDYNTSSDVFNLSSLNSGFVRIGANMSSLGRVFQRDAVDERTDFLTTTALSGVDRSSIRRRNYKNLLPKSGWYDRTGFNMPGYLAPSTFKNYNTYLPLGFIPSSGKFTEITSYASWLFDPLSSITIPEVYGRCENLNSDHIYNGVLTLSTFPVRGGSSFDETECLRYATRGDCNPIIPLIHSKYLQQSENYFSSLLVSGGVGTYGLDPSVYNILQSVVNSSLDTKPNNKDDFFNFEFGRGIHKLYLSYDKDFGYHDLGRNTERDNGGFNVFAHTFGPGLFNGNLTVDGSAAVAYPELITSAYDNEIVLNNYYGSGLFSLLGAVSGTYTASSTSDFYIDTYEHRNPHLLSGVELIIPSGTSQLNSFTIYKIDPQFESEDNEDFAIDNTLLKIKTVSNSRGLHRVKFNLSDYGTSPNYLVPEHNFNLTIPNFMGRLSGDKYGGGTIGAWVHTEPENGYVWSWTPNLEWKIYATSDLTPIFIQNNLIHKYSIPLTTVDPEDLGSTCAGQNLVLLSLKNLNQDIISNFSINFNTLNRPICIPNYYNEGQQVHRLDQQYSVEVMMFPDSTQETYVLIDKVLLTDTTLASFAEGYTEEEIQKIFLFFRSVMLGLGSRQSSVTSGMLGTSGGSRTEYRYHPYFGTYLPAGNAAYTIIDISR